MATILKVYVWEGVQCRGSYQPDLIVNVCQSCSAYNYVSGAVSSELSGSGAVEGCERCIHRSQTCLLWCVLFFTGVCVFLPVLVCMTASLGGLIRVPVSRSQPSPPPH